MIAAGAESTAKDAEGRCLLPQLSVAESLVIPDLAPFLFCASSISSEPALPG